MIRKWLFTLLSFAFLLFLWQLTPHFFPNLRFVLPSPLQISSTIIECKERFLFHSIATVKEMAGGFLLALGASFPLAWTMVRFTMTRSLLQPLFIVIQSLPMFALAPLMIIWCGFSYMAIILPISLMIFFPLTLNIYQGLKATPQSLLDFFHIHGATERQTLFKLRLPWALPHIFAGLKIAAAIAGMGAIAGEWAGAQQGLGILMVESRRNFDLEVTFGALACLTFLTTLFYSFILFIEFLTTKRSFFFTLPKLPSLKLSSLPKRELVIPLLSLIFLCTSGCHQPSLTQKKTILMLDWLPNHNHIPLYVGIQLGLFHKEGIDLEIQKLNESGGVLSYLTTHQVDLAIHHMPGTLKAHSKGAPITIIGSLIPTSLHALIYRDDSTITAPTHLTGKTLGYCIGGPDSHFLDFLLAKGKITPLARKNVSVDLVSALGTEKVDFIYGAFWNGEPHLLDSFSIKTRYFKLNELQIPDYDEMLILAHRDREQCKPEFISRFQRALQTSINFCKQEPAVAFALYASFHPDKREKTLLWERDAWQETYPLLAETQNTDIEKLRSFHAWQLQEGIIAEKVDLSSLLIL